MGSKQEGANAARIAAGKVAQDEVSTMYLAGVLETYMKDNSENIRGIAATQQIIANNLVEITAFTREQALTNKVIFKRLEDWETREAACATDVHARLEIVEDRETGRKAVASWWKQSILIGASMAAVLVGLLTVFKYLGLAIGTGG